MLNQNNKSDVFYTNYLNLQSPNNQKDKIQKATKSKEHQRDEQHGKNNSKETGYANAKKTITVMKTIRKTTANEQGVTSKSTDSSR